MLLVLLHLNASEDSTQEEKFRLRFSAMKAGTKLQIEDATGAKATVTFGSLLLKQVRHVDI